MAQTTMPVSVPVVPDSRFGYQVLPSAPTYVGSQSVTQFERDRLARKVTHPMTSAKGKTSGATAQVASDPDPCPTCTAQPPHSSGLRSNTPLAAPSSHHIPYVSPQLHAGDQRPQSRQSMETHCAQLAPSNNSHSSPLTEEDMEDESEQ